LWNFGSACPQWCVVCCFWLHFIML
jgi:hypothetical protein